MIKITGFVTIIILILSSATLSGQNSGYFGFVGLNIGSALPLGKLASEDAYRTGAGNAQRGGCFSVHVAYNIKNNYAVTGTLNGMIFNSINIENEFSNAFPEYQIQSGSAEYSMGLLMIGLRKNVFFKKGKLNHAFFNFNSGIEISTTPYERIYYTKIGGIQQITPVIDRKLSPVFNFGTGVETYINKNLAFNIRADYYISDLGTESVEFKASNGQPVTKISPDITLGLASRVGISAGLAIHFSRRQ